MFKNLQVMYLVVFELLKFLKFTKISNNISNLCQRPIPKVAGKGPALLVLHYLSTFFFPFQNISLQKSFVFYFEKI
jgi:hypothetical protein